MVVFRTGLDILPLRGSLDKAVPITESAGMMGCNPIRQGGGDVAWAAGDAVQRPPPSADSIPSRVREDSADFVGRTWVLDHVQQWMDAGDSPVFLLLGAPGCGKTSLMAWLAGTGPPPADVEAAGHLADLRRSWDAVHFCSRAAARGSVDPLRFTSSLSQQLTERVPGFGAAAAELLPPGLALNQNIGTASGSVIGVGTVEKLQINSPVPEGVFAAAVHEPLARLLREARDRRILLLVDGVDEALRREPDVSVLTLLAALLGLAPEVRLVLSCRPDDRIVDVFDSDGSATYLDLSDERFTELNDADMVVYMSQQVERHPLPEPPGPAVIRRVSHAAGGNFLYTTLLLREALTGTRTLTDLTALPAGLDGLYEANLTRFKNDRDIADDEWDERYKPILGYVAAATPAAPRDELPRWVGLPDPATFNASVRDLEQLVPLDVRLGGWRLFHPSLAGFLAKRDVMRGSRLQPNRYYLPPHRWHWNVAQHYLGRREGSHGDWRALGRYGLSQLVHHLSEALELDDGSLDRESAVRFLYEVVADPQFREAQRGVLGAGSWSTDDLRTALHVAASRADTSWALELVSKLAADPDLAVRAVAVEGLVTLHAAVPAEVLATVRALLAGKDTNAWHVALRAAYFLGEPLREVFLETARSSDEDLRQVAALALYLRWKADPDNFTAKLLRELTAEIRPFPSRRNSNVFEFLAEVSIAVYINHCDTPGVAEQTSELWRTVLKERMHLGLVNRRGMDLLIARIAARVYSRKILETALFAELQDPGQFFSLRAEDKAVMQRALRLLDPATPMDAQARADLEWLFSAEVPLFRVVAGLVLCVQAHERLAPTMAVAGELYERLTGRGRLWLLFSFSARLPGMPPEWVDFVERLTRRVIVDEPDCVIEEDIGTLATFDLLLLPVGLAYGEQGGPMPLVVELLERLADGDQVLVGRALGALGPLGLYHPVPVIDALRTLDTHVSLATVPGLSDSLATMRALHPELVDLYLDEVDDEALRRRVLDASDLQSVRRYVWWLGLYKNAVHQALHYPRMRENLLIGGLEAIAKATSGRNLMAGYARVPLAMLREADYELLRWTDP
jgi:hypothetical protein